MDTIKKIQELIDEGKLSANYEERRTYPLPDYQVYSYLWDQELDRRRTANEDCSGGSIHEAIISRIAQKGL